MTDIGQDLAKAAQTLADLAKEASYVAIGAGVLGIHKAQVRRQERSLAGRRDEMLKRAKDFDATVAQMIKVVDSTLEPVFQRLPQPVKAIVQQAREARDELRAQVLGSTS
jgi:hypothetical protein